MLVFHPESSSVPSNPALLGKKKNSFKQITWSLHWLYISNRSINLRTRINDLFICSSLYQPSLLCSSAHREIKRWACAMWIHYHVKARRLHAISLFLSCRAVKLSPHCVGLEKGGLHSKSEATWDLCCLALCQKHCQNISTSFVSPKK